MEKSHYSSKISDIEPVQITSEDNVSLLIDIDFIFRLYMDLHEKNELQSPGENSIELHSGNKYSVHIHPVKVTASANVAEIPN